jgi:hypothetical protein
VATAAGVKLVKIGLSELPAIAELLNLTPKEVFEQYLVVDGNDPKFVLRPRLQDQQGGQYLYDEETYDTGECALSKNSKCLIHNAKPLRAKQARCWDEPDGDEECNINKLNPDAYWTEEQLKELGWDGNTY